MLILSLLLLAMATVATVATVRSALDERRLQYYHEDAMQVFYLAASALAQAEHRVEALDREIVALPMAKRSRWFSVDCASEQAPPDWRDGLCIGFSAREAWPPCRRSARVALFATHTPETCRERSPFPWPDPRFRVEILDVGSEGPDSERLAPRLYRITLRAFARDRGVRVTLRSYWQVRGETGSRLAWSVVR